MIFLRVQTSPRRQRRTILPGIVCGCLLAAGLPVAAGQLIVRVSEQATAARSDPAAALRTALAAHPGCEVVPCWRPAFSRTALALAARRGCDLAALQRHCQRLARLYVVRLPATVDPDEVCRELADHGGIQYAERRPQRKLSRIPDDPLFTADGQGFLTFHGFPAAWDVSTGSADVVIAIVDSGVDYNHPDLADKLWLNPGEIPGNGIDDDGNGFVDDVRGWDFWQSGPIYDAVEDNDPIGDFSDHGTHVAGIAAAGTNNGIGVAGTGFDCRYMSVKAGGTEFATDTIGFGFDAILYAAVNGAQVINCSWGGFDFSLAEQDIIAFASELGAVVVCAAGNEGTETRLYPAAFAETIAVGGLNGSSDSVAAISNYGTWLDVLATTRIHSTIFANNYGIKVGTSMSTPVVSGLAGLLRQAHPSWSPARIRAQIRAAASPIYSANNAVYADKLGHGRVDAARAMGTPLPALLAASVNLRGTEGSAIQAGAAGVLELEIENIGADTVSATLTVTAETPGITVTEPTTVLGQIATSGRTQVTLPVVVAEDFQLTSLPVFRLGWDDPDSAYNDFTYLTITDLFSDLCDVNSVAMTLTSTGSIGFTDALDQAGGIGFVARAGTADETYSLLFEGALMLDVDGIVIDQARADDDLSRDFVPQSGFTVTTPGLVSAADGFGRFQAAGPDGAPLLDVALRSFAFTQPELAQCVLLQYTLRNLRDVPLNNVVVGQFDDWDIDFSATNSVHYQASGDFIYTEPEGGSDYPLTAVATIDTAYTLFAIDNAWDGTESDLDFSIYSGAGSEPGFSDSEKQRALHAERALASRLDSDVSTVVASGPFHIPANDEISVGFVYSYGEDLPDLTNQIEAARARNAFSVSTAAASFEPVNQPPALDLRSPQSSRVIVADAMAPLALVAVADDDGLPADRLTIRWQVVSGGDGLTIADPEAATTIATFSGPGAWTLRVTADDGFYATAEECDVFVDPATFSADHLTHHWTFDEGAGTEAADSSGHNRNAALANADWYGGGLSGNALALNGNNSVGSFTAVDVPRLSIAAWVFSESAGDSIFPRIVNMPGYLFYWGRDTFGEPFRDDTVMFYVETTGEAGVWHTAPGTIGDQDWYHIAVSYDPQDEAPTIYVNGQEQAVEVLDLPFGAPAGNAGSGYIGNSDIGDRGWHGYLDDLRLYDRILSPVEIALLAGVPDFAALPQVDAGAPQAVAVDTATQLTATASAITPTLLVFDWVQLSGPDTAVIVDGGTLTPTVTLPAAGEYVLQLAAHDGTTTVVDQLSLTGLQRLTMLSDPDTLTIAEGTSATVSVRLTAAPPGSVTLVPDFGVVNPGVTVSPAELIVTLEDWQTARQLTVTASEDVDTDDDLWLMRFAVPTPVAFAPELIVEITSLDDDVPIQIAVKGAGNVTPEVSAYDTSAPLLLTAAADDGWQLLYWSITPADSPPALPLPQFRSSTSITVVPERGDTITAHFEPLAIDFIINLTNADIAAARFGIRPDASAAFDDGVDELADPTGSARVFLRQPAGNARESALLAADFRNLTPVSHWRLVVELSPDAPPVIASWDVAAQLTARLLYLQPLQAERPSSAPIDMAAQTSLTVAAPTEFDIVYAAPESSAWQLAPGWNLISTPLLTTRTVATFAADVVWGWSGAAFVLSAANAPLLSDRGYWLHLPAETMGNVVGVPADELIRVQPGWQLIGVPWPVPAAIVTGADRFLWSWDSLQQTLQPVNVSSQLAVGRGYWLWSPTSVTIALDH